MNTEQMIAVNERMKVKRGRSGGGHDEPAGTARKRAGKNEGESK